MGQLGIIRDLLFYLVPKTCLEDRAGRDHATPVSLSAPHTRRAPHKFSTQPSPRPNPQPSYNRDFLPVHSPLNSKPSSTSCPNPHPQGAHPPESIKKGSELLKCSPLVAWLWGVASPHQNQLLVGAGQGAIQSTPWEAPGGRQLPLSQLSSEPRPVTHPWLSDPGSRWVVGTPPRL